VCSSDLVDGVLAVVEQLAGHPLPASALETLVLPARVGDYQPSHLDELTTSGEVVWAGQGPLGAGDGWVSLHLADTAALTLPAPALVEGELAAAVLEALAPGGAWFFRQLAEAVGATDDHALAATLWDLVWAGHVGNDSLAPLRALARTRATHRSRRLPPRARPATRLARTPSRLGPPQSGGRWSLLPAVDGDPTRRAHALADQLLGRHGVLTRGAVAAEEAPGGFGGLYKVLSAFEDSGRCRRGYFVEGLGAAQFALPGAVDRLRASGASGAVVLAATDPANPFGAALPWPAPPDGSGHRPGRKAGALVVLVDGTLVLYLERGGRTLLSWTEDPAVLQHATGALGDLARGGGLGRLTLEKADGEQLLGARTPLRHALEEAGFATTPRGLRLGERRVEGPGDA
jgi:ATP-dependent Lhr-like helicase